VVAVRVGDRDGDDVLRQPVQRVDRLGDARRAVPQAGINEHEAVAGLDEEHVDAPQADLPYTASDRLGFHVRASFE